MFWGRGECCQVNTPCWPRTGAASSHCLPVAEMNTMETGSLISRHHHFVTYGPEDIREASGVPEDVSLYGIGASEHTESLIPDTAMLPSTLTLESLDSALGPCVHFRAGAEYHCHLG